MQIIYNQNYKQFDISSFIKAPNGITWIISQQPIPDALINQCCKLNTSLNREIKRVIQTHCDKAMEF